MTENSEVIDLTMDDDDGREQEGEESGSESMFFVDIGTDLNPGDEAEFLAFMETSLGIHNAEITKRAQTKTGLKLIYFQGTTDALESTYFKRIVLNSETSFRVMWRSDFEDQEK